MPLDLRRPDNWPQPGWGWQDVDENGAPLFESDGVTPVLMDLAGSEFVLTIRGFGVSMVLRSEDDQLTVDTETNYVWWPITIAQARTFGIGKAVPYELQRIIDGTYETMDADVIIGAGGLSNG